MQKSSAGRRHACGLLLLSAVTPAVGIVVPAARVVAAPALSRSKPRDGARHLTISCKAAGNDADPVERLFACLPYLLPVLDGFSYGAYVYANVPVLGDAAVAAAPAVGAFQSSPFSGFILFIGLSIFTRNAALPRFVRFNIQQALLLDIALIIPGLFGPVGNILPRELTILGCNTVFYFWVLVVAYSLFCNVRGKTPDQVPVLSDAAAMQIGPM